jgi:hypothetical protein
VTLDSHFYSISPLDSASKITHINKFLSFLLEKIMTKFVYEKRKKQQISVKVPYLEFCFDTQRFFFTITEPHAPGIYYKSFSLNESVTQKILNDEVALLATPITRQQSDIWSSGLFCFVGQVIMYLCYNFHDSTLSQSKMACSSLNTTKNNIVSRRNRPFY